MTETITDYILDRVLKILDDGKPMTYAAKRVGKKASMLRAEIFSRRGIKVPDARKLTRKPIQVEITHKICKGHANGKCSVEYGYRLRKNEIQCPNCWSMDLVGRLESPDGMINRIDLP